MCLLAWQTVYLWIIFISHFGIPNQYFLNFIKLLRRNLCSSIPRLRFAIMVLAAGLSGASLSIKSSCSLSRQLPHFQSRPSVVRTGLAYLSLARVAGSMTCVTPVPQKRDASPTKGTNM